MTGRNGARPLAETAGKTNERPLPLSPDSPAAILSAWTALEALSPCTFKKSEELAEKPEYVEPLNADTLPWMDVDAKQARRKPKKRLFYQVVLGTVDMARATARLSQYFGDDRVERRQALGEAPAAVFTVDCDGIIVDDGAIVSSVVWALPQVLRGKIRQLGDWLDEERPLASELAEQLRHHDNEGKPRPVELDTITAAFEWLCKTVGIESHFVRPPRFAIRVYQRETEERPPEPPLLNSFFLDDLRLARASFAAGKAPRTLRQYMGAERPGQVIDLLRDTPALEDAVAPSRMPLARWPGPGRHPLVLLQQAAINLALAKLGPADGIFAVNGPPGTGKTTLLRDLVASVVCKRAEALLKFSDPRSAFHDTKHSVSVGNAHFTLFHLDESLRGFEIVVASSNNRAVENITKELPGIDSVANDLPELTYFSSLSDLLCHPTPTWGLIAAVLGNAKNRRAFEQQFWWDSTRGFKHYLTNEKRNGAATPSQESTPAAKVERAPQPEEAQRRWREACHRFRKARELAKKRMRELETARKISQQIPSLSERAQRSREMLAATRRGHGEVEARSAATTSRAAASAAEAAEAHLAVERHQCERPGVFARLFRSEVAWQWRLRLAELSVAEKQAAAKSVTDENAKSELQRKLTEWSGFLEEAMRTCASAERDLREAEFKLEPIRARLRDRFADDVFFSQPPERKHRLAPWLDDETHRARDDLFVAAMALHKAFIDAAARPLRHNIGLLLSRVTERKDEQDALPHLWSSLFLVVPVVSTTFSSVGSMFGRLPRESLGWLLIDEAGQAVPQAAVGALLRSKRAVVVGDPLQIEPIVTLPPRLTERIAQEFSVTPDRWIPPVASAQTLADQASVHVARFPCADGPDRVVGAPLLVHRRCQDPMFSISNDVAYARLMVQATPPRSSSIGAVLGPSTWIDVAKGVSVEKWSAAEGAVVLGLIRRVVDAGITDPDLYIITPFKNVSMRMAALLYGKDSPLIRCVADLKDWVENHVGTTHTFQGREADTVILVLGASAPSEAGARIWAGRTPNILNVAASRAKERLYVVGSRQAWSTAGVFATLHEVLGCVREAGLPPSVASAAG